MGGSKVQWKDPSSCKSRFARRSHSKHTLVPQPISSLFPQLSNSQASLMPSTLEKRQDSEVQLSFCSQKANLDEKAMAPRSVSTRTQRGGASLSGTPGLPIGQDLLEPILWAQGKGGLGRKILVEREGKVGTEGSTSTLRS